MFTTFTVSMGLERGILGNSSLLGLDHLCCLGQLLDL